MVKQRVDAIMSADNKGDYMKGQGWIGELEGEAPTQCSDVYCQVSAYFTSEQILSFGIAEQYSRPHWTLSQQTRDVQPILF